MEDTDRKAITKFTVECEAIRRHNEKLEKVLNLIKRAVDSDMEPLKKVLGVEFALRILEEEIHA